MIKLLKKTILPLIFAFVMILSVGCDNKGSDGNNDGNGGGSTPASYSINSAEAVNILDSLSGEIDGFIVEMNNKNILDNSNFSPNMIPSVITLLNDSYKASVFAEAFEEGNFQVNKLYANKTSTTDKFANVTVTSDEQLSVDFVTYAAVEIEGKTYEIFENYLYEVTVDEGVIKSLKVRNLISNDKIPSMSSVSAITMYEIVFDFENEVLDIFYAKPSKHYAWMLNDEYLDYFFDAEKISDVVWGTLYKVKIDLKAQSTEMITAERYIDELSDTLKNEVLNFSYTEFDENLTTFATSENFEEIEDVFANIADISNVEYDDVNNKFALAG